LLKGFPINFRRRRGAAEARSEETTLQRVLAFLDGREDKGASQFSEPDRDQRWTVWFNAWKYENSEQVWAGLVDAIVTQVSDRIGVTDPVEREMFLLRLNLARIDDGIVRRRIYERVYTYWLETSKYWIAAAATVIVALIGATEFLHGLQAIPLVGSPLIALATIIGTYSVARTKIEREPARFSLSDYMRVPDYTKSVGVLHEIHHDLERVLRLVPNRANADRARPLIVFIDDLDRCSPGKVASVVEGINMFLASDLYECMFVIGMDPQVVAAALDQAHKDVREFLPQYERTVPLGWRFMDKFVQLPFTIPPCDDDAVDDFIRGLFNDGAGAKEATLTGEPIRELGGTTDVDGRSATGSSVEEGSDGKGSVTVGQRIQNGGSNGSAKTVTAGQALPIAPPKPSIETKDVEKLTLQISSYLAANPREIKRLLNMVRFYLFLRAERLSEAKMTGDVDAAGVPELDHYRRWILLSLRWPDMMRWLQWGAEQRSTADATISTIGAVGERLAGLERAAYEAEDIAAWQGSVRSLFGFGDQGISWLADPKLFDFFKGEAALEQSARLSHVVRKGFY
jgi:hypothetical protein